MSLFAPPPPPPTKLGRYRQLSSKSGVHVSPLALGAMSIGDKWNTFFGNMSKENSYKLLDAYFNAGGNFIDTANNQDETSEMFIGHWMEERGNRDQLVIATKFSLNYQKHEGSKALIKSNFVGNNVKSMNVSIEASLKKLKTSYIDILYVHFWDYETSVEEVMNGLHNLVQQGKVLYLGVSDTPAWVVSKANQYARDHGKTQFVIYQGAWNVMERSFERDIIPMARDEGMALAPWNVLARGKLRSDAEEEKRRESGEQGRQYLTEKWERNEDETKMSRALEKVAKEVGVDSVPAVAIAYVMQKTRYVFPIIGGRKVEHLQDNIKALDVSLSAEQIKFLEDVLPFDPGFPNNFVGDGTAQSWFYTGSSNFDKLPVPDVIRPGNN